MRVMKHPAFPGVTRDVADDKVQDWKDQGWVPLLDEKQERRLAELEAETALEPAE